MSGKLEWVFAILDKVSAPAKTMERSLGGVEDKFKSASEHTGGFFEKMRHGLETVYFGKEVLGSLAEKVHEFGAEMIKGIGEKQHDVLGLTAMMGDSKKAKEIFEHVEAAAFRAGKPVADVMAQFKDLLSAGFDVGEIDTIRKGLGDLAVLDPSKAAILSSTIADIGRNGMMTSRQLMQLRHILPMDELRKQLGVSADGMDKLLNGAKAIESGKAITAVLKTIRDRFSGGFLGSVEAADARTLPKLLTRVRALPEMIMDEVNGFREIGESPFDRILENLIKTFDPSTDSGKKIVEGVKGLVDEIARAFGLTGEGGGLFAELAGPNGPAKMEAIFKRTIEWVKTDALPAMRALAGAFVTIARAVEKVAGFIAPTKTLGFDSFKEDVSQEEMLARARAMLGSSDVPEDMKIVASKFIRDSYGSRPPSTAAPSVPEVHFHGDVNFVGIKDGEQAGQAFGEWFTGHLERLQYQRGG